MKYIMIEQKVGEITRKIPIIFPDILIHKDIADAIIPILSKMGESKIVSAGNFNNFMCDYTIGKSSTLNIEANVDDAEIINSYDYFHGIIY